MYTGKFECQYLNNGAGYENKVYRAKKQFPESRHKDTDQCLIVAISFCRHRSVPVPCKNSSAETTVAKGGRNPVAGLWGRTPARIDHLANCHV